MLAGLAMCLHGPVALRPCTPLLQNPGGGLSDLADRLNHERSPQTDPHRSICISPQPVWFGPDLQPLNSVILPKAILPKAILPKAILPKAILPKAVTLNALQTINGGRLLGGGSRCLQWSDMWECVPRSERNPLVLYSRGQQESAGLNSWPLSPRGVLDHPR